jgi:HlyD family secretion protein
MSVSRIVKIALAPLGLAVALAIWLAMGRGSPASAGATSYEFATVGRTSIESVVTSTGTLSPVSKVSVLAQMTGRVEKVHADYNDRVHRGQVLAALNTDMLRLEEQQALASVNKAQANYNLQSLDVRNKSRLAEKGLIADYDLKSGEATLAVYAAELASAQASLRAIQTRIGQYALITSPIDGIVLERSVDVGQSVVEGSSSNSSSLFTIAEDLSRMQIEAEVDELDIGSIKVGQDVRFSVEAVPRRALRGTVQKIRLVPQTTDNLVNYTVIVQADNSEGVLLPGMTASIQFIKQARQNVLAVPNAALRFEPSSLSADAIQKAIHLAGLPRMGEAERREVEALYDGATRKAASRNGSQAGGATGLAGMIMPRPGGPGGAGGRPPGAAGETAARAAAQGASAAQLEPTAARKPLWYIDSAGNPVVVLVETGASNATMTEIVGAEELEGTRIMVRVKRE